MKRMTREELAQKVLEVTGVEPFGFQLDVIEAFRQGGAQRVFLGGRQSGRSTTIRMLAQLDDAGLLSETPLPDADFRKKVIDMQCWYESGIYRRDIIEDYLRSDPLRAVVDSLTTPTIVEVDMRCTARNFTGGRCKRNRTVGGTMCRQHEQRNVYPHQSVQGMTTVDFAKAYPLSCVEGHHLHLTHDAALRGLKVQHCPVVHEANDREITAADCEVRP